MDHEKLIGQLAVAVPIIHIGTCTIYLAGYSAGFGGNIGSFFSAGDLFGVSISELFWTYLTGLGIPMLLQSNQFRPGYRTAIDRAIESGDDATISSVRKQSKIIEKLTITCAAFLLLIATALTYLASRYDYTIHYQLWTLPISIVSCIGWFRYARKLKTTFAVDMAIVMLWIFALSALANGLTKGQSERRSDYEYFSGSRPRCDTYVVLRPLGDRFLAVAANGQRAITSIECKPVILFAPRPHRDPASGAELFSRWWHEGETTAAPVQNGRRARAEQ